MSDSAKLHLCYGIILLILSFLCFAGFVSGIWLSVLMGNSHGVEAFITLSGFAFIGTIVSIFYCVRQLLKAGFYMSRSDFK